MKSFFSFVLSGRFRIGFAIAALAQAALATEASALPSKPKDLQIGIEPIVGFEHVQKLAPQPHLKNRLTYGARVTAGYRFLSGEAEYTRGTHTESYPAQDLTIQDTDDKLKLGIRSGYALGRFVTISGRGGGQAKRNSRKETTGGVTHQVISAIEYDPYLGTELRAELSNKISLSVGVVAIITDVRDMSRNEYQATGGFQIRLP
jgi:hypothetical protein